MVADGMESVAALDGGLNHLIEGVNTVAGGRVRMKFSPEILSLNEMRERSGFGETRPLSLARLWPRTWRSGGGASQPDDRTSH